MPGKKYKRTDEMRRNVTRYEEIINLEKDGRMKYI